MQTLRIGKQILSLEKPLVMGILNLTPDSFYDGGKFNDLDAALAQIQKMVIEGVDILDVGAFSSRPGAKPVPVEKQIEILKPVVEAIITTFPQLPLSIDTRDAEVVNSLAEVSSFIVNDISGAQWDNGLLDAVAKHRHPYVAMHMLGTPETMQNNPEYDDVCAEVLKYLANLQTKLRQKGITDVIVDPGFGFGKTIEHNYRLLAKLEVFQVLESPVLVGLSRKSMVYKPLNTTASEALNGTTALHMMALSKGTQILRVHDVKEAVETRNLWLQLQSCVND